MSFVVEISHLYKDFYADEEVVSVLKDVNLKLNRGEISMLIGPSGCGKTTLISILAGILSPTKGKVSVFGTYIHEMQDTDKVLFRRNHIGFIFQQYHLIQSLSALENVCLPLLSQGINTDQAEKQGKDMLDRIGLIDFIHKYPNQLSGGQQQRVCIARALIHNPSLIICDEPTSALDATTGRCIMELLQEMTKTSHASSIIVTHDPRIYSFADHVISMSDGMIIQDLPADLFFAKEENERIII
ncbi:MAG: ABC transporter ATP-binding protein [Rhabdochlamydiaceae bacterium]